MRLRLLALASLLVAATGFTAHAQEAGDEIVRLPGQGFTKKDERKAHGAPERLVPGGVIALELQYDQAERVSEMMTAHGLVRVERRKDYGGHERVVSALKE